MTEIVSIDPPSRESRRLWRRALELARAFGTEEHWVLVGGLMVQLHAFERGTGSRLTADIDFLGDSRRRPPMTKRMVEVLIDQGAEMALPPVGDERLGYRFEIGGDIVEILGSDGVRSDPPTLGRHTTIQVPGGSQALARAEVVRVSLDGAEPTEVRRPSLLGSILIKSRVVAKRRDRFDADRLDVIRLLSFVEDPRALAEHENIRKSERGWLRSIAPHLAFDDPGLTIALTPGELLRAEQAHQLLTA